VSETTSPTAPSGELTLLGRVRSASNATFYAALAQDDGSELEVVYKPIAGERPLWDFPDGKLAYREVAAYLVSELLGWNVVPQTWLADGPHGPGMVQRWCHADEEQEAVTIVPGTEAPPGWHHVFEGFDARDRVVSLVHEESVPLRRMAVFDAVVNNADRKGGHVLEMPDGHRYGIDHGLTLHREPKLRTVLWGWAGEPLTDEEAAAVARLRDGLYGSEADELGEYLASWDVDALADRCDRLLAAGTMPEPRGDHRAIPWPPF